MRVEREDRGLGASGGDVLDRWTAADRREPRLEELMEDPMMDLLWRRDGLEPVRARETMRTLQQIVRTARRAGRD